MRKQPQNPRELIDDFNRLLEQELPEQQYQEFIEQHSRLIPREFVQNHGIHFDLVLRKLSLAKDYTSDFFYLAKSSADWNCVLVEIEKPQSRFFKPGNAELHSDFVSALDQIHRWRAWFSDRANLEGFINGTLKMVRVPHGMTTNPCHIKYVLVMGRRSEFEDNSIRRNLIYAREQADFHILSYDSLIENLNAKRDLYIGIRKNEHIKIISERFVGESIFDTMPSEQLRINENLRQDILANRDRWYHFQRSKGGLVLVLDNVLPKILST